ncbi:hypothetical protein BDR26DRAFT_943660 [Obelidium mucronatum]|nr:hypothetical protein BDR26DRAFT_943656 [Obelidium mucronatum]KAI9323963.1 hypothetical protein BDR26DRAFT_943660 [Obelidium mucronatum]
MDALPDAAESISLISVDTQLKVTDPDGIPQNTGVNAMETTGNAETNLVTKTTQLQTAPTAPADDPNTIAKMEPEIDEMVMEIDKMDLALESTPVELSNAPGEASAMNLAEQFGPLMGPPAERSKPCDAPPATVDAVKDTVLRATVTPAAASTTVMRVSTNAVLAEWTWGVEDSDAGVGVATFMVGAEELVDGIPATPCLTFAGSLSKASTTSHSCKTGSSKDAIAKAVKDENPGERSLWPDSGDMYRYKAAVFDTSVRLSEIARLNHVSLKDSSRKGDAFNIKVISAELTQLLDKINVVHNLEVNVKGGNTKLWSLWGKFHNLDAWIKRHEWKL